MALVYFSFASTTVYYTANGLEYKEFPKAFNLARRVSILKMPFISQWQALAPLAQRPDTIQTALCHLGRR